MTVPSLVYDLPVTVRHNGENVPGTLTVARRVDGKFWEGKVFCRPNLYLVMEQVATPRNGGFAHLTDEDFLLQVRTVFGFDGGCNFDFGTTDFRPLTAGFRIDLDEVRRTLH